MDIYHRLREKLDSHPVGAPDRPEILEILRTLFSLQEAEMAVHLGFALKPAETIAEKSGISINEVIRLGEGLANKGLVLARVDGSKKSYSLLPLMPGIFEFPFMKTKYLDFDFDKLAELWHRYYERGWGLEFHSGKTSMSRIIPVRKTISAQSTVLPYEEVTSYITMADCVAVGNCACRVAERKCDNPIEVCMSFGSVARFFVERKMARFITKKEAIKILDAAEEAGLVHLTSNTTDRIGFICNCCRCCCVALGVATRLKDVESHPISNFYASIASDKCNACGVCKDRCPAGAIDINGVATVNVSLCIGCGLCATACPTEAIELLRRQESVHPPAGTRELALRAAEERGKLQAFIANV